MHKIAYLLEASLYSFLLVWKGYTFKLDPESLVYMKVLNKQEIFSGS